MSLVAIILLIIYVGISIRPLNSECCIIKNKSIRSLILITHIVLFINNYFQFSCLYFCINVYKVNGVYFLFIIYEYEH